MLLTLMTCMLVFRQAVLLLRLQVLVRLKSNRAEVLCIVWGLKWVFVWNRALKLNGVFRTVVLVLTVD